MSGLPSLACPPPAAESGHEDSHLGSSLAASEPVSSSGQRDEHWVSLTAW